MARICGVCVAMLCLVSPAMAQDAGRVSGIAGATFQARGDAVYGGEAGWNVTSMLELYGGGHYMRNVFPRDLQDRLNDISDLVSEASGDTWRFQGRLRAITASGGARFRLPTGTAVRPYVLAGAGVARLKVKVIEFELGDITQDLIDELTERGRDPNDKLTKAYFEFGGGLEVPVGTLFLDAGYRYGRLMDYNDADIKRAYIGVGARF